MNTKLIMIILDPEADVNRPELSEEIRQAGDTIEPLLGLSYVKTTRDVTYFEGIVARALKAQGRFYVCELTGPVAGHHETWVTDWFKNSAKAA